MHITQNKNRDITLTQKAYSKCMLEHFKMNHCVPTSTPLPPGSLLLIDDYLTISQETSEMAKTLYCEALGSYKTFSLQNNKETSHSNRSQSQSVGCTSPGEVLK